MIRMFEGLADNEALYNLVKRIYFMNLRYEVQNVRNNDGEVEI